MFCTIYDGSLNGEPFNIGYTREACFGRSLSKFKRIQNTIKYSIILIRNYSYVEKDYKNYCWMTKHQLENYLRRISSIKPFKYRVYEDGFKGTPCFKIDLKMVGTKKEVTFVLQCIKRTYEWPYSFFLQQAYEMQKLPAFKFDSILNLYNVAFSTYRNSKNTDHSFSGNTKFEKYSTLREKMPHIQYASDLFPKFCNTTRRAPKLDEISYCDTVPNVTEQWDETFFRKMLPYYIENYKVLKQ